MSVLMEKRPVRKHIRLAGFSYRTPGSYFVTICCAQRRRLFDRQEAKRVVEECWKELPRHFPMVELGEFVVMPNHVHGIVTLVSPDAVRTRCDRRQRSVPLLAASRAGSPDACISFSPR